MTPKIPAASQACGVAGSRSPSSPLASASTSASAEPKRQYDNRGRPFYGPNGPNVVYQQGPHTRIYVTKRSWLDAGAEVLPGDRKFTDYAYPPEIGYPTFARENNNRPIDRQPTQPAVGAWAAR